MMSIDRSVRVNKPSGATPEVAPLGFVILFLLVVLATMMTRGAARADFPPPQKSHTEKPYPPVQVTTLEFSEPRPLRVWIVQIDLTSPDIDFVVTPPASPPDKNATVMATTLEFARQSGVQLAINGSPFGPYPDKNGE